jgi:hypothetical protein
MFNSISKARNGYKPELVSASNGVKPELVSASNGVKPELVPATNGDKQVITSARNGTKLGLVSAIKSNKITQDDFLAYSSLAMLAGFIIVLGFGFGLTASIPWMLFGGALYVLIAIAGNALVMSKIGFYEEELGSLDNLDK